MNKYKKPKYNAEMLGENPFVQNLVINVSQVKFVGQYKKDKDDTILPYVGDIENDTSTRVYNSADRRLRMSSLTSGAKGLLLWIIFEAESGKDYFWLNRVRFMDENKIKSVNTYRAAINELISMSYVSRTVVGGVYWINPALFFNGNRVLKFPHNVKKRKLSE